MTPVSPLGGVVVDAMARRKDGDALAPVLPVLHDEIEHFDEFREVAGKAPPRDLDAPRVTRPVAPLVEGSDFFRAGAPVGYPGA